MSEQRNGEPWRDYVEREIRHLREVITIQAREHDRRLKRLNEARDEMRDAADKSLSREKYNADREADRVARRHIVVAILGLGVGLIGVIVGVLW